MQRTTLKKKSPFSDYFLKKCSDYIIVFDEALYIIAVSDSFLNETKSCDILGKHFNEVSGTHFFEFDRTVSEIHLKGRPFEDPKKSILDWIVTFDEYNKVFVAFSVAVSKSNEVKLQEELKSLQAEFDQFVYIASHDLNEPARTIQSFVQFLNEDLALGKKEHASENLSFIIEASNRLKLMLSSLLELSRSRNQDVNPEPTNLPDLVNEVFELYLYDDFGDEIKFFINGDSFDLEVDKLLLRKVLAHVLRNSFLFNKHAPHDKSVEISIEKTISSFRIMITDNGIGIDLRNKDRIFEPFQRLNGMSDYAGVGMGLAIVKKMLVKLSGSIELYQSTLDSGSTFLLEIHE